MISSVSTLRLGGAVTGLDGALWALEVATGHQADEEGENQYPTGAGRT